MKHLFSSALAAVAFCAAFSAHAQTWTVTGLNAVSCGNGDTEFAVNFSGLPPGTWYYDTTVDAAGKRFMDEYFNQAAMDGPDAWDLYNANDRGLQTQLFPLPAGTPITVTLTLRDSTETPVYYTVVQLSRCDGGVITFNQSGATLPRIPPAATTTAASVPTLGETALALLGLLLAGGAALRMRRR